jgi:putative tricarboxylic transport membrane protein
MEQEKGGRSVGSIRLWELVVAALFLIFGAGVMWDSWRIGARWAEDGPQAGYFPFYIGLFIVVSAVMIIINALRLGAEAGEPFVTWGQLRMVLTVLIPTVIYVFLIDNPWYPLGIYVPSIIFIAAFMRFLGKYGWIRIALVSIGVMVAFFVAFEIWFQVPLPKGPVEALFGYA